MKKPKIAKTSLDGPIEELAAGTDHKTLAIWAADCAERVLPLFEDRYPEDDRPRSAIEALRAWIQTGEFKMADVRSASLSAHAAARDVEGDDPARSAARSAGQAMASAHVGRHAIAAARYATSAVRDLNPHDADAAAMREREWQYQHLRKLRGK